MTMTIKELDIPIYTGKVVVCISDDCWTELKTAGLPRGGFKKKEAALCLAWVEEAPTAFPTPNGSKARWIVAIKPTADLNTVAHECYHLTNYLAAWFGFEGKAGEDEAAAYIHGWLMEQIWGMIREEG